MLHFLQPIWLLAIAGIIFPVIIHLWNIKEGKTLKIGSIALLTEGAKQQAQSLKVKDIILLILRCLVIAALALLLTKPLWQKLLTTKESKGWVLLDQQNGNESYNAFKPLMDSLLASGCELHYFNTGFERAKLEEVLKKGKHSTDEDVSYWTLLKQLDEQIPAELPVYIFTNNSLSRFKGTRPQVALNVYWNTYTSGDSTAQNIVNARFSSTDSIRAVMAHSTSTALRYSTRNVSLQNPGSDFRFQRNNGRLFIATVADTMPGVEVDTAAIKLIIYTDQFSTDAAYVKAAIDAIQQFGKYRMQVEITSALTTITPDCNWLFWLSEKEIPASFKNENIFIYEKGKEKPVRSWIQTAEYFSPGADAINLHKLIVKNTADTFTETVWQDGFGETVLSLKKNESFIYHFYSRFNPAWNDLVWSEQFPQIIFDLILQKEFSKTGNDKRTIDAHQLQPAIIKQNNPYSKRKFVETIDLSKVVWIIAFVLFCLERYISLTGKKERYA